MGKIRILQQESYKKLEDLYGLFFEDINHAADGGLYAELIQNRSFEYDEIDRPEYNSLTAWEKSKNLKWQVKDEGGIHPENPHYLTIETKAKEWISNVGYGAGIYVESGKDYDFSVFAKTKLQSKILVLVKDKRTEQICAQGELVFTGENWSKYELTLRALNTTTQGILYLQFEEDTECCLDMISLFPQDTFKGRKNGLRRDIAEALAQMEPKFMRFPGGCLVHDGSLNENDRNSMYRWKKTIGPVEHRPSRRNNWRYNQTLGLGYYEYFCFCEDIGAKPLPVLPGGFNPHKGDAVPLSELGAWVQEALDLIEFAKGDVQTKWGALRAEYGHPEPFDLEYIGIGNEEIGNGFFERYPYFHEAIRKAYPEMKIINTAGPFAVGEGYEDGWASARAYGSDYIDEHYYSSPEWYLANMHHYEDYDANGTKVFLGEYASWGNTYYNALVEAAYMTHLEKSPAVGLACYAPMLCHKDYVNWKPDMLWFDNHRIMKTPNYYVQQMFMKYQGTDELKVKTEGLDEVVSLYDKEGIPGKLMIQGNDVEGKISDIVICDETTGKKQYPDAFDVTLENLANELGSIDAVHYSLEFTFKRSSGRKGLNICFGRSDDDNQCIWEFGGWDNWDCNVNTKINGRGSAISHRIFHVTDEIYRLRLEVSGHKIETYVNGERYNTTQYPVPQLEELYVCASMDERTNATILKVVNLTGEAKNTQIEIGKTANRVRIVSLNPNALDAQNSFEKPNTIYTQECEKELNSDTMSYEFAAHSVSILIFE